jgi:hypothetical protein
LSTLMDPLISIDFFITFNSSYQFISHYQIIETLSSVPPPIFFQKKWEMPGSHISFDTQFISAL